MQLREELQLLGFTETGAPKFVFAGTLGAVLGILNGHLLAVCADTLLYTVGFRFPELTIAVTATLLTPALAVHATILILLLVS